MTSIARLSVLVSVVAFGSGCVAPADSDPIVVGNDAKTPARAPATSKVTLPAPSTSTVSESPPVATGCPTTVAGGLFCDSFEATLLEPNWSPALDGGTARIDAKRALTGTQSIALGFGTLPSKGRAALELHHPAIASAKLVSLRFHIFLPVDGYPTHVPLGGLAGAGEKGIRLALDHSAQLVVEDTSTPTSTRVAAFGASLGKWTCVAMTLDRDQGSVEVSLDASRSSVAHVGTAVLDHASLGLDYDEGANANASVAAWYDDVALASARLECP